MHNKKITNIQRRRRHRRSFFRPPLGPPSSPPSSPPSLPSPSTVISACRVQPALMFSSSLRFSHNFCCQATSRRQRFPAYLWEQQQQQLGKVQVGFREQRRVVQTGTAVLLWSEASGKRQVNDLVTLEHLSGPFAWGRRIDRLRDRQIHRQRVRETDRRADRQTYNMRPVLYKVSLTSIAPFRVNLHVISLCAAVADESPNHSQFQTERKIQIRVEWKENYKFLLLASKRRNLHMIFYLFILFRTAEVKNFII